MEYLEYFQWNIRDVYMEKWEWSTPRHEDTDVPSSTAGSEEPEQAERLQQDAGDQERLTAGSGVQVQGGEDPHRQQLLDHHQQQQQARPDPDPAAAVMPGDALSGLGLVPMPHGNGLRSRRKMSTPAALQDHHALALAHMAAMAPRRRFSNVSDAVSRKLSSTIGWRTVPAHAKIVELRGELHDCVAKGPPADLGVPDPTSFDIAVTVTMVFHCLQEIVGQGKALCGQYIRSRLKRAGLFDRKCGLQRLRSAAALNAPQGLSAGGDAAHAALREVFCELNAVGLELERRHPKVYTGVARQAAAGPIVSDKAAASALTAVGRDLLKHDVTWGKVISLYAVAGALAVDCVRQGHPEYLHALVAAVGQLLEDDLAPWIADNGGWVALVQHCTRGIVDGEVSVAVVAGFICAVMAAVVGALLALRAFGKFALI
ncbi:Bcl-2-related ovarian killer protein-like protein A [Frankliniella fusca]|uniref:Bcl-2-related ovarian killer protein-like protein A n=1 Tax=Frankliniella fusca TaxID=407009 RepID=A0AAE1HQI7_9NEOP|nr:Bcl-2-related ovarian killer protein-like protein A [Frankliniella fusca]